MVNGSLSAGGTYPANLVFRDNWAQFDGGGAWFESSDIYFGNTSFINNDAGENGGGLYVKDCSLSHLDVTYDGNNAIYGGGLAMVNGRLVASDLIFRDKEAQLDGGGAWFQSADVNTTLSNLHFGDFRNNNAGRYGGGMFFEESRGRVVGVTASNNISDAVFTRDSSGLQFSNVTFPAHFRCTTLEPTTSVPLAWDAVTGATGYVLQYRKATDTEWTTAPTPTGTSTVVTGLTAETEYVFRVQATRTSGASDWASITVTTGDTDEPSAPATPTNFRSTAQTADSVTLAWDAATDAMEYMLQYKKASDADWTTVSDLTETTATITGLAAAMEYNFRIQAINDLGSSDWATVNATTDKIKLTAPTLGSVSATGSDTIRVTWNATANASGYVIQYATNSTFTAGVGTITVSSQSTTSANITRLNATTTYYVRIMATGTGAYNNSDYSSAKSAMTDVITLPKPTIVNVMAMGSGAIMVTWNAITGASGYVVQYATDADFTAAIGTVTIGSQSTTSTIIDKLTANTTYYVRVMATGTATSHDSDYSDAVSATTLKIKLTAPTLGNVIATGNDTINMTWNAISTASGYEVQYASDAAFTTGIGTITISSRSTTSINITGLSPNTTYYVRIMATGTGDYDNSDYSASKSVTTPGLDTITMPDDDTPHDWTLRKSQDIGDLLEIVDLKDNSVLYSFSFDTLEQLVINTGGTANDSLTIDFSNGIFSLDNGIQFNGHTETCDTLYFIGSDGDDSIILDGTANRFNDLSVYTQNIEHFILDGGTGNDQALVIGTESDNTFNVSDDMLVMIGGGYRWELGNFNTIDAIAAGRNDRTYLYAENDSFIVMNDTYVERHSQDQSYRVWYSKQVIAVNTDNSNSTILHTGSRCYDVFTLSQNYATATNAVGSYHHEIIGFENFFAPFTGSQPATMESPITAKHESAFAADSDWDENLFAFLADEQMRSQRKQEAYYATDDWLVEFTQLALLELRK